MTPLKSSLLALSALALLSLPTRTLAQNLIPNADFTSNTWLIHDVDSMTDWTTSGNTYGVILAVSDPPEGYLGGVWVPPAEIWNTMPASTALALDGGWTQSISQTLNSLTVGQHYTLSFDQAMWQQTGYTGPEAATGHWNITLGSDLNADSATMSADNTQNPITYALWEHMSYDFTASSTSQLLTITAVGTGNPPILALSNLELTATPVPEPHGVLLVGIAGSMALLRRRRI